RRHATPAEAQIFESKPERISRRRAPVQRFVVRRQLRHVARGMDREPAERGQAKDSIEVEADAHQLEDATRANIAAARATCSMRPATAGDGTPSRNATSVA